MSGWDDWADDRNAGDVTGLGVVYRGYRGQANRSLVTVETPAGEPLGLVRHVPRHSRTGFGWGADRQGAADLARSLLLAALDERALCPDCRGTMKAIYDDTGRAIRPPYHRLHEYDPDQFCDCMGCSDGFREVPYREFVWRFISSWDEQWQMERTEILVWLSICAPTPSEEAG